MQDKLFEKERNGNITIKWNNNLDEVLGDKMGVTGIRIKSSLEEKSEELEVHGVFIAIGTVLTPAFSMTS